MCLKSEIKLEYSLNCTIKVLYTRLSNASGLSEWFADDVKVKGNFYTFFWGNTSQTAERFIEKIYKTVRFQWIDGDDKGDFFEFTINKNELTGDVSLDITDFAEKGEENESINLWNSQIDELKRDLGC
ncbi:MAG: SRPBCC domain-containing protein [Prolixibacteraceae bacterium]|nr:SRPBCC domain-containing protein [Prolixibacteraceae bacterium]